MTRKRRSPKQAQTVKLQLAAIIKDIFDGDGQVVTHEMLAARHVARNASVTAAEDVQVYGGPAVAHLRTEERYAIVPITAKFEEFTHAQSPVDEVVVANAVAGLGAGGPRIGWYHPSSRDDWLWVFYIGHLGRAGVAAVFHAGKQVDDNPSLVSPRSRAQITERAIQAPPAGKTETKVLTARIAG